MHFHSVLSSCVIQSTEASKSQQTLWGHTAQTSPEHSQDDISTNSVGHKQTLA